MDPSTDRASENSAVLGKRKRSPRDEAIIPLKEPQLIPGASHEERMAAELSDDSTEKLPYSPRTFETVSNKDVGAQQPELLSGLLKLPLQLLQHVCCFLDPFTLAMLMRVNRTFRALLDPRLPLPQETGSNLMSQNSIWSISRTNIVPEIPQPMRSMNEYDMLRLIYGRQCQFCGKLPGQLSKTISVNRWSDGPGPTGVRAIWPFQVKCCADCLRTRLVKENDLMRTTASAVQPGLPFACFTPSLHYVTSLSLTSIPSRLKLTKYYYQPQIETLDNAREEQRLSDPGLLAEWYRGLNSKLQDFMIDSTRFEQWEEQSRPVPYLDVVPSDTASASSVSLSSGQQTLSGPPSSLTSTVKSTWHHYPTLPHPPSNDLQSSAYKSHPNMGHFEPGRQIIPAAPGSVTLSLSSNTLGYTNIRPGPNIEDIARLKTEKKIEIERRCQQLDPPLYPYELENLKSFHAALKIVRPLDSVAWEHLKSRLIAERHEMLMGTNTDAKEEVASVSFRQTIIEEESQPGSMDPIHLRAQVQRPTRDKLYDIAHDFIKRLYRGGTGLTETTAPQFAADVLVHVRQQFYLNQERDDAALSLQGLPPVEESQSGIRTRVLKLEHMKYVFEACIKQYTELVTKDLFLCSACNVPDKHYGFDAIIQHYAAKHTEEFSRGNTIVYWKALWPECPPFRANPGEPGTSQIVHYQQMALTLATFRDSMPANAASLVSTDSKTIGRSEIHPQRQMQSEYQNRMEDNQIERPIQIDPGMLPSQRYRNPEYPTLLPQAGDVGRRQYVRTDDHTGYGLNQRDHLVSQYTRDVPSSTIPHRLNEEHYLPQSAQYRRDEDTGYLGLNSSRSLPRNDHSSDLRYDATDTEYGHLISQGSIRYVGSQIPVHQRVLSDSHIPVHSRTVTMTETEPVERFLASFDGFAPQIEEQDSIPKRLTPTEILHDTQDLRNTTSAPMDRRSNISQPRRTARTDSIDDPNYGPHNEPRYRDSEVQDQRRSLGYARNPGDHDEPTQTRQPPYERPPPQYIHDHRYPPRPIDDDYYDHQKFPRQPQMIDQYGRLVRPPSPRPVQYTVRYEEIPYPPEEYRVEDPLYTGIYQATRQPISMTDEARYPIHPENYAPYPIDDHQQRYPPVHQDPNIPNQSVWNDRPHYIDHEPIHSIHPDDRRYYSRHPSNPNDQYPPPPPSEQYDRR